MDLFETNGNGNGTENEDSLPPPPPVVPPDVVPVKAEQVLPPEPAKKKPSRVPMARRGLGSKGQKMQLLTNHFKVNFTNNDGHFFQYSVCLSCFCCLVTIYICLGFTIHSTLTFFHFVFKQVAVSYEDGRPVEGKGVGRKVLEKVQETYDSELNGKDFAYDGEKTLFTIGSLARNKLEFDVVLEDVTSNRSTFAWWLLILHSSIWFTYYCFCNLTLFTYFFL